MDVTLLIVGSDFKIHAFYPRPDEVGKSLNPGEMLTTPPPPGEISDEPPFGPETLVVLAAPACNPPTDFTPLAQDGLPLARAADRKPQPSVTAKGPAGVRDVPDRLTWRIEPDSRRPIRNANTGVEDRAQVNMWPLERLLPVPRLSV